MAAVAVIVWAFSLQSVTLLDNRLIRHVGRVSFSGYLTHFVVISLAVSLLGLHANVASPHAPPPVTSLTGWRPTLQFAVLAAVVLPVTVLLSTVTYHVIERPGIAAGNRLTRRLGWGA